MSERPQPLRAFNKLFEGREPWQIVTMTASSVLALVWAHSLCNARESKYNILVIQPYFIINKLLYRPKICILYSFENILW